jgi:hypothetical protein
MGLKGAQPAPSGDVGVGATCGLPDLEGTIQALLATGMCRWDAMVTLLQAGVAQEVFPALAGVPHGALRPVGTIHSQTAVLLFDEVGRDDPGGGNRALAAYLGTLGLETPYLGSPDHEQVWLTALPANLRVGEAWLSMCLGLTALPAGLEVETNLFALRCPNLTTVPPDLKVGEDLNLLGAGIRSLPAGLKVGGSLTLSFCEHLEDLPEGLRVRGDLDLRGCPNLKALPAGLKVDGGLLLGKCTGLTALPEDLAVAGCLDLEGCVGLTALPAGLRLPQGLSLKGCTGLTALPEDLEVQTHLILLGCTAWDQRLPEGVRVPRLELDGYPRGITLEDWRRVERRRTHPDEATSIMILGLPKKRGRHA